MAVSGRMQLSQTLLAGRLVGRRKRFFVDVATDGGGHVVAHCPNTGRLIGCLDVGADVVLHGRARPGRVLPWTWVLVRSGRGWVGVESALAIPLVVEALDAGRLPALAGYAAVHRELRYGVGMRSRVDLVLADEVERTAIAALATRRVRDPSSAWVEVKSTTLVERKGGVRVAAFPDAPTERGRKHLEDLVHMRRRGQRAAIVFAVQRADADVFAPADHIDPAYGVALRKAIAAGVEAYALGATIRVTRTDALPRAIDLRLSHALPIVL